jgi:nucleoid-associated protein YgaU
MSVTFSVRLSQQSVAADDLTASTGMEEKGEPMATFDELKGKYQTVIQLIQAQGVQLANLHVQDGKLLMKGTAPSQDAANKVWDEIKRINPRLDDIIADFPVDTSRAAAGTSKVSNFQTYTVKAGDTLSKISKQFYGNANDYMRIFEANKDQLKNPDQIQPGQNLKIPAA